MSHVFGRHTRLKFPVVIRGEQKLAEVVALDLITLMRPEKGGRLMIPKYYLGTGSCLLRKYICGSSGALAAAPEIYCDHGSTPLEN
jgi:hypothetical protein